MVDGWIAGRDTARVGGGRHHRRTLVRRYAADWILRVQKGCPETCHHHRIPGHREEHTHLLLSPSTMAKSPVSLFFLGVSGRSILTIDGDWLSGGDCGGVKHEVIGMGTRGAIGLEEIGPPWRARRRWD